MTIAPDIAERLLSAPARSEIAALEPKRADTDAIGRGRC